MIARIMVPTDGSPRSEQAIPIAAEIAGAQNAEVVLAQVLEYPVLMGYGGVAPTTVDLFQKYLIAVEEEADANLSRLKAQLEEQRIPTQTFRSRGSVDARLLDLEREQAVDLVVMTTHGRSGLARFALGSVADRLVREGTTPVLIVRGGTLELSLKSALLLLDGSGLAEEALPIVETLAGRPIEAVKLFRVVDDPIDRNAARTYLEGVGRRLATAGLKIDLAIDVGDPAMLVGRAAQGTDLVVLSTHGRGGFNRFRHGSVADRVVREVEKPVLLVRAGVCSAAGEGAAA